jgi:hypothetical protein
MADDDRAEVEAAVVVQRSPHILAGRTQRAVQRGQRIGTVGEIDLVLPCPRSEFSAVG